MVVTKELIIRQYNMYTDYMYIQYSNNLQKNKTHILLFKAVKQVDGTFGNFSEISHFLLTRQEKIIFATQKSGSPKAKS